MTAFAAHDDAWTRADAILDTSKSMESKFLALQVRGCTPRLQARSLSGPSVRASPRAACLLRLHRRRRAPSPAAACAPRGVGQARAPHRLPRPNTGAFPPSPQVLESVIKYRWMALPVEQREGIKNYVATVVIKARARARGPQPAPRALACLLTRPGRRAGTRRCTGVSAATSAS